MLGWLIAALMALTIVMGMGLFVSWLFHLRRERISPVRHLKETFYRFVESSPE